MGFGPALGAEAHELVERVTASGMAPTFSKEITLQFREDVEVASVPGCQVVERYANDAAGAGRRYCQSSGGSAAVV